MKNFADQDQSAHYDKLLKENSRLQERIVTLEVEVDSLKNKNSALLKEIDKRAYEVFLQQIARIKQVSDQALHDASKADGGHT